MNPSPTDLAWAAGFLDGEGCFTLLKQSGATHASQRAVHVSASQTCPEPLEKLVELFGGHIGQTAQTATGNAIFMWRLGEARAIESCIARLLPYLVVKKREAEIVSAFAATVRRRGRPHAGQTFTDVVDVEARLPLIAELEVIRGR